MRRDTDKGFFKVAFVRGDDDPMDPLDRRFFERDTPAVARALLGHHVVVPAGGEDGPLVARIVETEAYLGPEDPGSHARLGRHTRAGRLWDEPGAAYVYVCYGVHQMLNVVAHPAGGIGAVLVRAAEPVAGVDVMRRRRPGVADARLLAGPGNLGKALGLTAREHDGFDLTDAPPCLARGRPADPTDVAVTGRIGLTEGGERLLRFLEETSASVSSGAPQVRTH